MGLIGKIQLTLSSLTGFVVKLWFNAFLVWRTHIMIRAAKKEVMGIALILKKKKSQLLKIMYKENKNWVCFWMSIRFFFSLPLKHFEMFYLLVFLVPMD